MPPVGNGSGMIAFEIPGTHSPPELNSRVAPCRVFRGLGLKSVTKADILGHLSVGGRVFLSAFVQSMSGFVTEMSWFVRGLSAFVTGGTLTPGPSPFGRGENLKALHCGMEMAVQGLCTGWY